MMLTAAAGQMLMLLVLVLLLLLPLLALSPVFGQCCLAQQRQHCLVHL